MRNKNFQMENFSFFKKVSDTHKHSGKQEAMLDGWDTDWKPLLNTMQS